MLKNKKKFYLEADDFGFMLPGLDMLMRLRSHYDGFKFTAFLIPLPKEFFLPENIKTFSWDKYKEWATIINSYDWLEIGIHGFSHTHWEYDKGYKKTMSMIDAHENMLETIGLKYKKIFRAPYWQYSYGSMQALKDRGYTICVNPNNRVPVPEGAKTYEYNWSFETPLPKDDIVKGHGHMYETGGSTNSLERSFVNMLKVIPQGAEFGFISELTQ